MALLINLVEEPTRWRLSAHGDLESGECYHFRMTADQAKHQGAFSAV